MCCTTEKVSKNEMSFKKINMKSIFAKIMKQAPSKSNEQESSSPSSSSSIDSSSSSILDIKNLQPLQKQVSKVFGNLRQSLIENLDEEMENERRKVERQRRIENRKLYGVIHDLNRQKSTSSIMSSASVATMTSEESPHEQLQHYEKTTLVPDQNNVFHEICLTD